MPYEFIRFSDVEIIKELTENTHLICEDDGNIVRFLASKIEEYVENDNQQT